MMKKLQSIRSEKRVARQLAGAYAWRPTGPGK
jgi:hypothetical protein